MYKRRPSQTAAGHERRSTHTNARADHLESCSSFAFTFAFANPKGQTRKASAGSSHRLAFLWGQLYRSCIAPMQGPSRGKIFACRDLRGACTLRCASVRGKHARSVQYSNPHQEAPSRRPMPSSSCVLHNQSATRNALPHLLPCTHHTGHRYATTGTSGSTCSSPNTTPRHASYSPAAAAAQRQPVGDASAGRNTCAGRNVLAPLDVRGSREYVDK